MGRTFQKETTKLLQAKRRRRRWKRAIVPFALTVVLATSSMLTYPAITLESSTICGMGDHTHTQECYQRQLICGRQECEAVAEKTETVLNCSLSVHEHTAECVDADGQNVCRQDAHTHGDGCYQTIYTPGVEGHKHTDACYQDVLICQKPQHTHSDACYSKQETSADSEEPVNTETSVTPEKPASTEALAESEGPANTEASAESGEAVSAETSAESGEPASTGTSAESGEPANTEASAESGESANTEAPTESANPEASVKPEESAKSDVPKDSETTETSEEEDSEIVWEAQTFTANGKDYTITVEAPASAKISKGAVLTVKELQENTTPGEYQNYSQQAVAKVQQKLEKDVLYARYFKLAIEADGIEIQPAEKVTVKVTYRNSVENPSGAAVKAVFFGDTTEILDVKTNASGQNWNEAKVEVGKMTVLAIAGVGTEEAEVEAEETENVEVEAEAVDENKVEAAREVEGIENLEQEVAVEDADPEEEAEIVDEDSEEAAEDVEEDSEEAVEDEEEAETEETEPEVYILTATGEDYRIEASYTAEAELPEDTVLVVSEIEQGTEAYESYCQQALTAVQENERTVLSFARFFDLTFFAETEEIEAKAPVTVKITYTGEEEVTFVQLENGMAVMVLQNEENEKEAIIETESLGVYGIVAVEEIPEELSKATANVLTAETEKYIVTVSYGADAGLPEDVSLVVTVLSANSAEYQEARDAVVEEKKSTDESFDESTMGMDALDITLYDAEGNEIEPIEGAEVNVTIQLKTLPEEIDMDVLKDTMEVQHIKEDSATTVADTGVATNGSVQISDDSAQVDFTVDHFSTFTVTWTEVLETTILTADGATYTITVEYDSNAGIPKGATLNVTELDATSEAFQNEVNVAEQIINGQNSNLHVFQIRSFDIKIMDGETEIQPTSVVNVTITAENVSGDDGYYVLHTHEGTTEVLSATVKELNEEETQFSFETESFSKYTVTTGSLYQTIVIGDDGEISGSGNSDHTWTTSNETIISLTNTTSGTVEFTTGGVGTAVVTHQYKNKPNSPKNPNNWDTTRTEYFYFVVKGDTETTGTFKVYVYVSAKEISDDCLNLLGISSTTKDNNGYFPAGEITLDSSFLVGKEEAASKAEMSEDAALLITNDDWDKLLVALGKMDTSTLADMSNNATQQNRDYSVNRNNSVSSYIKNAEKDLNGYMGSHKSALFRWNMSSSYGFEDQTVQFHLDLRFKTNKITFIYGNNNIKSGDATDGKQIEERVYIKGSEIQTPNNLKIPEGYVVAGYYSDADFTEKWDKFGKPITQDETVYVRLIKISDYYITVTKEFEGLTTAQINELTKSFSITLSCQTNKVSYVLMYKDCDKENSNDSKWVWKVKGVPEGVYTVTESNETVSGYDVKTEGLTSSLGITLENLTSNSVVVNVVNEYSPKSMDVVIEKTDTSGNPLNGAKFQLYKVSESSKETLGDEFEILAEGITKKLTVGEYCLEEILAPSGYIIENAYTCFSITTDAKGQLIITLHNDTDDQRKNEYASVNENKNKNTITIQNTAGVALPNTGGSGTLPYTLSGLLLMTIAMMYGFVLRRRKV